MRIALATLWVLMVGASAAGVYWGFLITPESTIWSLMVSAILAALALALVGLAAGGAIAVLWHGLSAAAIGRAVRSVPGVLPAAALVMVTWWIANRAEGWFTFRSGPISAWFIARLGWDDIAWLVTAVAYAADWFRWVVAGLLALSLMAGFVGVGWRAVMQPAWMIRALHPRAVLFATVWFVLLIAVPWRYLVPWRPEGLPPTSAEFAFIAVKLGAAAILGAAGVALIAYEASRTPLPPRSPTEAAIAA
jgi:hypothetical protein